MSPQDILAFWFDQTPPERWWKVDAEFDALIRERFLDVLQQAAAGELHAWRGNAKGRLAEIIVLDQFPRNIHRGTPAAFACDPVALVLAQEAVAAGALAALTPTERSFLLLPYMHSESARIHEVAEVLYRAGQQPGLRAAAQGHHRPLRALPAPQHHPRPRIDGRRIRVPETARLKFLTPGG